jgi:hypothetical protein
MTEVNQDLSPDKFADIKVDSETLLPSGSKLNVHVTKALRPGDVDASSLIFGVSTTFGRFNGEETSPLKEWTRWLTDGKGTSNGAGLILTLFNISDIEIDHAYGLLTTAGNQRNHRCLERLSRHGWPLRRSRPTALEPPFPRPAQILRPHRRQHLLPQRRRIRQNPLQTLGRNRVINSIQ